MYPPSKEAVRDAMPVLFDLIREENEPCVRVVPGHFIFVYIHPYIDGNGRMGRFLMNVMLASGGYPWMVVPVEQRDKYRNELTIGHYSTVSQMIRRLNALMVEDRGVMHEFNVLSQDLAPLSKNPFKPIRYGVFLQSRCN